MNNEDITRAVAARLSQEASALKSEKDPVDARFVQDCLAANELGDGTLYATLHAGRHIRNVSLSQWHFWGGHHWEVDMLDLRARRSVEDVALKYIEAAESLTAEISKAMNDGNTDSMRKLRERQGELYRRAKKLRAVSGSNNCIEWASAVKNGLAIREEEFDRDPWLLACRNGVLELKTGRFRPGRPEDYLTRAVPHDWLGIDHPAPEWERFLAEVFEGDTELIGYLRRALGYGVTGLSIIHMFLVLHGEGRNGKGTLVETVKYVLGELAKPIQSEMLLDQKNARSSSSHSSDIMSLKGLRLAFASETDKHRRFSPSKVKWLTGGDSLTARPAHAPFETTFKPTHLLCLLTNHLPHASGDDFAFWQRLHLVPFRLKYVDNPREANERKKDEGLPARLEAEASGILAWLVRGCLEWQRDGLNPPLIVRAATEQYRVNEDILSGFIEARCFDPKDTGEYRTSFKDLYASFRAWYSDTIADEKHCPRKKDFSETLSKRFRKATVGGQVQFYGISLDPYKADG